MPQNEILSTQSALDGYGQPRNFGWSRSPCLFYDPALLPRRRVTESDRYIIFSPTHLVIFELIDAGYLGYMGVSVISLKDKRRSTQYDLLPLSMGSFGMPTSSDSGAVRYRRKGQRLDFICMEAGARIIQIDIPRFGHNRFCRGELVLLPPENSDSLVVHTPWKREPACFRYARCSPWYQAEGMIQFGTTELAFTQGRAWGIFEWNRVRRPRRDFRFWASACGLAGKRRISFCIGYDSSDSSAGTENGFFVDGTLYKLDQVTFQIGTADAPWYFSSNDGRLTMTFTPHQERVDHYRMLFVSFRRRQFCGFFSGKVILDDGEEIEFKNLTGFAERKKTKF